MKGTPVAPEAAATTQPSLDRILEDLAQVDPAVLAERLAVLQSRTRGLSNEIASLKEKLAEGERELVRLQVQVNLLDALVKARRLAPEHPPATAPAPETVTPEPPAAPAAEPAAAAAPPAAPEPAPELAAAPVTAQAPPDRSVDKPVINFVDHILPLVNDRCIQCHNPEKARGELILATFDDLMTGGANGKIVVPGSAEESRLYRLVTHVEEPFMPPMQSKLDEARLDLIRQWIEAGAPADAGAAEAAFSQRSSRESRAEAGSYSISFARLLAVGREVRIRYHDALMGGMHHE